MKTTQYVLIFALLSFSFTGCAQLEEQIKNIQKETGFYTKKDEQIDLFKEHGYNKEIALRWIESGFDFNEAKPWLENNYTVDIAKNWKQYNFDFQYMQKWKSISITNPKEANSWRNFVQTINSDMKPIDAVKRWLDKNIDLDTAIAWRDAVGGSFDDITSWIDNGISIKKAEQWKRFIGSFEVSNNWISNGIDIDKAKAWNTTIGNFEVSNSWISNGFSLDDAKAWKDAGKTPQEAKGWIEFGFSPTQSKGLDYTTFIQSYKQYKLTKKDIKLWAEFGEIDPRVIHFFKSKGIKNSMIAGKNIKSYFNSMSNKKFFKLMGIKDIRIQTWYLFHWKYTSHYTRVYKILRTKYGIDVYSK